MQVTYWVAKCKNDAPCYNIRAKTRRTVVQLMNGDDETWEEPVKVTLEYAGAFELVELLTQEGGPAEVY